ncbi:MAG: hypothetical protein K9M80_07465, partial [Candidatus Marinimicrobia bacterium]|nr:hypothetical protein [Candidatus Neomarinimicrobiota bacterium]
MMKKSISMLVLVGILFPTILCSQIMLNEQKSQPQKMSRSQARITLLKSIALPGWGEHSLGYNTRGYAFQGAEMLSWAAFAAFTFFGNAQEKTMRAFAAEHAGIDPTNKDKNYFADIGSYEDIYKYNAAMYRNRSVSLVYADREKYYWSWDSKDNRQEFDDLRYRSGIYLRNASLAATALLINRIVSVIDIMSLTSGRIEDS